MVYTWACLHEMMMLAADEALAAGATPVVPSLEALVLQLFALEQE